MAGREPKGKDGFRGFSRRLAEVRQGQYTQAKLGELVGLSEQTIRKYESGERQPDDFDIIVKLAKELHVSTDYLLGASLEQNEKMRDVASFIGVSQPAAAKLEGLQRDAEDRMLPLNGLIMHRNFEVLMYKLWCLHDEAVAVKKSTPHENNQKGNSRNLIERTISGSDLLRHDLDRVVDITRELFEDICMVKDATETWDKAVTEQLLSEYDLRIGGKPNGEENK